MIHAYVRTNKIRNQAKKVGKSPAAPTVASNYLNYMVQKDKELLYDKEGNIILPKRRIETINALKKEKGLKYQTFFISPKKDALIEDTQLIELTKNYVSWIEQNTKKVINSYFAIHHNTDMPHVHILTSGEYSGNLLNKKDLKEGKEYIEKEILKYQKINDPMGYFIEQNTDENQSLPHRWTRTLEGDLSKKNNDFTDYPYSFIKAVPSSAKMEQWKEAQNAQTNMQENKEIAYEKKMEGLLKEAEAHYSQYLQAIKDYEVLCSSHPPTHHIPSESTFPSHTLEIKKEGYSEAYIEFCAKTYSNDKLIKKESSNYKNALAKLKAIEKKALQQALNKFHYQPSAIQITSNFLNELKQHWTPQQVEVLRSYSNNHFTQISSLMKQTQHVLSKKDWYIAQETFQRRTLSNYQLSKQSLKTLKNFLTTREHNQLKKLSQSPVFGAKSYIALLQINRLSEKKIAFILNTHEIPNIQTEALLELSKSKYFMTIKDYLISKDEIAQKSQTIDFLESINKKSAENNFEIYKARLKVENQNDTSQNKRMPLSMSNAYQNEKKSLYKTYNQQKENYQHRVILGESNYSKIIKQFPKLINNEDFYKFKSQTHFKKDFKKILQTVPGINKSMIFYISQMKLVTTETGISPTVPLSFNQKFQKKIIKLKLKYQQISPKTAELHESIHQTKKQIQAINEKIKKEKMSLDKNYQKMNEIRDFIKEHFITKKMHNHLTSDEFHLLNKVSHVNRTEKQVSKQEKVMTSAFKKIIKKVQYANKKNPSLKNQMNHLNLIKEYFHIDRSTLIKEKKKILKREETRNAYQDYMKAQLNILAFRHQHQKIHSTNENQKNKKNHITNQIHSLQKGNNFVQALRIISQSSLTNLTVLSVNNPSINKTWNYIQRTSNQINRMKTIYQITSKLYKTKSIKMALKGRSNQIAISLIQRMNHSMKSDQTKKRKAKFQQQHPVLDYLQKQVEQQLFFKTLDWSKKGLSLGYSNLKKQRFFIDKVKWKRNNSAKILKEIKKMIPVKQSTKMMAPHLIATIGQNKNSQSLQSIAVPFVRGMAVNILTAHPVAKVPLKAAALIGSIEKYTKAFQKIIQKGIVSTELTKKISKETDHGLS